MVNYIPDKQDLIWLNFDPQSGKEIKKTRPVLVISPKIYHQKSGLALCMPITSKIKGYPFEVPTNNTQVQGVILCDQVRSLDWKNRKATFIDQIDPETFHSVLQKLLALITP